MADEFPDSWEVVIPDFWPIGPNKTLHAHWANVCRAKRDAQWKLYVYTLQAGEPKFEGKVRVTFTRRYGKRQRAMDDDNLWGSVKPLLDGLQPPGKSRRSRQAGMGIITNDSPKHCKLLVQQHKSDDGTLSTHILIEGKRIK